WSVWPLRCIAHVRSSMCHRDRVTLHCAIHWEVSMSLRTWRFITLMLAALGMTMGAAHVLELPPKMQYDAPMYTAVTSTLYRLYGVVGGGIQVAAILAAAGLSWRVRGHPAGRLTLWGTLCLGLSLGLWFALVQPVNAAWLQAMHTTPETV